MRVYAFVGGSGTGKSYRATWVAKQNKIEYIIDDGLLIKGNKLIAGVSAKRESTKLASVRRALFYSKDHTMQVRQAIAAEKPDGILILGTSDDMVAHIAKRLGLNEIEKTIYIEEVATKEEIEEAKHIRKTQGKHVIPVPTFEIKKDFSGLLLDTLNIFGLGKKTGREYNTTKSVVRPTFSYLGDYHISDNVINTVCTYEACRISGVSKVLAVRTKSTPQGIYIDIEIVAVFGKKLSDVAKQVQFEIYRAIENFTAVNVCEANVLIKSIVLK